MAAVERVSWHGNLDIDTPEVIDDLLPRYVIGTPENLEYAKLEEFLRNIIYEDSTDLHQDESKTIKIENELIYDEDNFQATKQETEFVSSGVTNFTIILFKDKNYDDTFANFKKGTHCSCEVIISYGDTENLLMRYGCIKIVEIKRKLFTDIFKRATMIKISKKPIKKCVIEYFEQNDITKKRCLLKCNTIIHGLALLQKDSEMGKNVLTEKKRNNQFSNYQRSDRAAGQQLSKEFARKHNLPEFASFEDVELKTKTSLDIYDRYGFLSYTSRHFQDTNAVFYENKDCLYLVKEKYLDAFGKVVVKKKTRSPKVKIQGDFN